MNAIRTINGNHGDSVGNFNGVVTSIDGITATNGNIDLTDVVRTINGDMEPDEWGNIGGIAVEVDGHQANQDGQINFNLANSKWVKTSADGHLTTTDETPIAIDTSQYTPTTAQKKVIS